MDAPSWIIDRCRSIHHFVWNQSGLCRYTFGKKCFNNSNSISTFANGYCDANKYPDAYSDCHIHTYEYTDTDTNKYTKLGIPATAISTELPKISIVRKPNKIKLIGKILTIPYRIFSFIPSQFFDTLSSSEDTPLLPPLFASSSLSLPPS